MSDPVVPAAERSRWNWKRTNQTQRTLLDAALELFIENGYAGTSVEDIVQRSNLSIGSLYHHFGNKAGLYLALWQEWVKDQENLVSTAIEELQSRGEAGTVPLFMVGARAFDVLCVLVDHAGQLVTKKQLFDLVWPGLVVEEKYLRVANYARNLNKEVDMIAHACGLQHAREFRREHVRLVSPGQQSTHVRRGWNISGEEIMKSAEARLHATGTFQTTAMRSSALKIGRAHV